MSAQMEAADNRHLYATKPRGNATKNEINAENQW